MRDDVQIFVFGSCHFSKRLENDEAIGNGGYGVVIKINGLRQHEFSAGYSNTTNARMDLAGILEGLKRIERLSNVIVYLANGYIVDALTKGWLDKWNKNGYKKIKHADLWKELYGFLSSSPLAITVRHSKDVKYSPDFLLAEKLGQTISVHKNLPSDLIPFSDDLIANSEVSTSVLIDEPILDSLSVDASCIGNPGPTEYRGVDTKTKKVIFEKRYALATNNIGEFLAIVHALALYKNQGKQLKVIYSDSLYAISWVKQKKCKTQMEPSTDNSEVMGHIQRAVTWLENNEYETQILKWNTAAWGEIPADYGRK